MSGRLRTWRASRNGPTLPLAMPWKSSPARSHRYAQSNSPVKYPSQIYQSNFNTPRQIVNSLRQLTGLIVSFLARLHPSVPYPPNPPHLSPPLPYPHLQNCGANVIRLLTELRTKHSLPDGQVQHTLSLLYK